MSIYSTLFQLKVFRRRYRTIGPPRGGKMMAVTREGEREEYDPEKEFVEVFVQGVPAHIDWEIDWLPPLEDGERWRAVLVVLRGTPKEQQRYASHLLMLRGSEYREATFDSLLRRIEDALT